MAGDGGEFWGNGKREKEKKKKEKIDKEARQENKKAPDYFEPEDESVYVDISSENKKSYSEDDIDDTMPDENILRDIVLEPDTTNKNKKKYIVLGFALIILFILTIIIIRVASNSSTENELEKTQVPVQKIETEKKLDTIETEKEYKDLITKNQEPVAQEQKIKKQDLILPEPIKEKPPVEIIQQKPAQEKPKDIFGIKEKTQETQTQEVSKPEVKTVPKKTVEPKPVEKPKAQTVQKPKDEPKRKIVVAPPAETNFVKSNTTKPKGFYIQVGAFSKKPSDKFLNNLEKKGYNYTIYTVNIKGKNYNKVLVGPYPTKGVANNSLSRVQKDSRNKNAYILKF
jgi:DedD protein